MQVSEVLSPLSQREIQAEEVGQTSKTESSSMKGKEVIAAGAAAAIRKIGITRPPLNFLSITKGVDPPIDTSFPDKLCDLLYAGVYLKPNKLKYFVDKELNKNCFVLFARELNIIFSGDPERWKWRTEKESSGEDIEVAKLVDVCWLQVKGKIRTIDLSPGIMYEIVFVVRKGKDHRDQHSDDEEEEEEDEYHLISHFAIFPPLKLTIFCPNSVRLTRSESLGGKPLRNWFEIQVGEFMMSPQNVGNMEFSLEELSSHWKHGLFLKCAIIRPKKISIN